MERGERHRSFVFHEDRKTSLNSARFSRLAFNRRDDFLGFRRIYRLGTTATTGLTTPAYREKLNSAVETPANGVIELLTVAPLSNLADKRVS